MVISRVKCLVRIVCERVRTLAFTFPRCLPTALSGYFAEENLHIALTS